MDKIIIYTDGGCRGNPGIGGWGVFFSYKDKQKKLQGSKRQTTNNQMELTAAIKGLENIKTDNIEIDLYTDSKYVINGINEWIKKWRINNWRGSNKKLVKNVELWQRLDELNSKYNIKWHWVRGHSNDFGNDMADKLANDAMDEIA